MKISAKLIETLYFTATATVKLISSGEIDRKNFVEKNKISFFVYEFRTKRERQSLRPLLEYSVLVSVSKQNPQMNYSTRKDESCRLHPLGWSFQDANLAWEFMAHSQAPYPRGITFKLL